MNNKHIFQNMSGYMLLEVMVSVMLVSTALIFLTARISQSIQGSTLSEEKTVATRLAQGGAEWLKGWRDDVGWAEFKSGTDFMNNASQISMCWDIAPPINNNQFRNAITTNATCPNSIEGLYSRRIDLVKGSDSIGEKIEYTVTISWTSGRKERNVVISGEMRERST